MKLEIDFVSQQGNQARNDCGAACLSMVTGNSIDDVLLVANRPKNEPLHLQDMMAVLRAYRVDHEHVRPLHLPDARRWLANGNPVIALVGYGRLPDVLKASDYSGNHYVVIVGYEPDGSFWVHDPLRREGFVRWPDVTLGEAWANPVKAMPLQGIVVKRVFEVAESSVGDVLPLVREEANKNASVYLGEILAAMGVEAGPLDERVGHALAWVAMRKGRV